MANRQDFALFLHSLSGLGDALRKQRDEQIEKELLTKIDPNYHGEPLTAYKFRRQIEDQNLARQIRQQQLTNAMQPQSDTVMDDLDYRIKAANADRAENAAYGDGTLSVDEQIKQAREQRLREQFDEKRNSAPWLLNRAIARGKLDEKGVFTNNYAGADAGDMAQVKTPDGQTLIVPYDEYARRTKRPEPDTTPLGAKARAEVVRPQMPSQSSDTSDQAQKIRAAYKAGTITREEAKAQLQALGFE